MIKKITLLAVLVLRFQIVAAQERVTTVGIVVKPLFPSKYFRTGLQETTNNNVDFSLKQKSGFSAGAVIRKGFTKTLSVETGIAFVKRNYHFTITDSLFNESSDFKIIGYEIPLQALVFVQLSKDIWMNGSLGPSIDIFPSDVSTSADHFVHRSYRTSNVYVFNTGITANLGWEWRTVKSGYFYAGMSYHRSVKNPYGTIIAFIRQPDALIPDAVGRFDLQGDYFTFDLRYYFHENPENKKKK
jgi:hypothetical protein